MFKRILRIKVPFYIDAANHRLHWKELKLNFKLINIIFSGCNGNENRFANRRQCYAKCGRKLKVLTKQSSFSHFV